MLAFVEIHDPARFAQCYIPSYMETLGLFGGQILAVSDETSTVEGSVPTGRTILLEFPDSDSARQWYASDAYAPLLALRKSIATSSVVFLPGGFTLHN
jgi:uncharacterized protein (DUF1330 family)